jgi:hypothetical protein
MPPPLQLMLKGMRALRGAERVADLPPLSELLERAGQQRLPGFAGGGSVLNRVLRYVKRAPHSDVPLGNGEASGGPVIKTQPIETDLGYNAWQHALRNAA